MPILLASIVPKPGQFEVIQSVFERLIPRVHAEDGCELFALHRTEDCLVLIEKWRDEESLSAHSAGPSVAELRVKIEGLMAREPEICILEPMPFGDVKKGTV